MGSFFLKADLKKVAQALNENECVFFIKATNLNPIESVLCKGDLLNYVSEPFCEDSELTESR